MYWVYLLGLIVGIAGMATIDWRYKLAYWHDRSRTLKVIGAAVAIFVVWDVLGIVLGIFRHGGSQYQLPFTLFPHFPVEEIFFLVLLTYTTLVIYTGASRWRSRI